MNTKRNASKRTIFLLALGLAVLEAHAGPVGAVLKVAGKVAEHGADNVAEHVVAHQADDIAEAAGKGAAKALAKGGTQWAAKGGTLEKAVEGAVKTARAERKIGAKTILAAGGAVAAVDAAHNLSKGRRNRDEGFGKAEERVLGEHPEYVVDIRRGENRWKDILAVGGAVALLAVALPFALAAGGFGGLVRRGFQALRRRRGGRNGEKTGGVPEKRADAALSAAEERKEEPETEEGT